MSEVGILRQHPGGKRYATLVAFVAVAVFSPVSALADTWDEPINVPRRFKVLSSFNDQAVSDKETGLVWEQSPSTNTFTWDNAQFHCNNVAAGDRLGWRIPTVQELASLVDPNNTGGNPDLPPGHPFSNVQSSHYWSATTVASFSHRAWVVRFDGPLPTYVSSRDKVADSRGDSPSPTLLLRADQVN